MIKTRPPLDPVYVESLHAVAQRYLEMYRTYGPEGSPLREQMTHDERTRVNDWHELRETMSATFVMELCEAWLKVHGRKSGD